MATLPRQVLPGTTYLVTRRCSERRFFLRPSALTNAIFEFVLAVAAERYGILVHAYCVMSNHFHLVLTDPDGRLPLFHQFLDSLVGRAVNHAIGHSEAFWDRESFSAIPLVTPEDIFAKIVYVLANPVAARLVRRAREWPGLWSDPARMGGPGRMVVRPVGFFGPKSRMPRAAPLELTLPPGFDDVAAFRAALEEALHREEREAASALQREGRGVIGGDRVRASDPFDGPRSVEERGRLQPRVAGRSRPVLSDALVRLREFVDAYRAALAAWRSGVRDVVFPAGTWAMRVHHGVCCAAAS